MATDKLPPVKYSTLGALFNEEKTRRFLLWRDWKHIGLPDFKRCAFVMLNPSQAGYQDDDPTVRKCVGFARRWGFGGVTIANLIPIVATDPWDLPFWKGYFTENERHLKELLAEHETVVVAWGHVDRVLSRRVALSEHINSFQILAAEKQLYCLGHTALRGSPRHPSRAPYGDFMQWNWSGE